MTNLTATLFPPLPTIHVCSLESVVLQTQVYMGSFGSGAYPAANRALYIPFRTSLPIPVTQLYAVNGTAVSGNMDMGVYTAGAAGPERRLFSTGSVAQTGTDTVQAFDVTDYWLGAGDYYWAIAVDNTTAAFVRASSSVRAMRDAGILNEAAAFPLPATATPVLNTVTSYPFIGLMHGRTVL